MSAAPTAASAEMADGADTDLDIDQAILDEVRKDGRVSIRTLATSLGIPETTARDRLHRLEETGTIRGYRAVIDPAAVGAEVQAWLLVEVPHRERDEAARAIAKEAGVERVHGMPSEPDGFAVRVSVRSVQDIHQMQQRWAQRHHLLVKEMILLSDLEMKGHGSTYERDEQNRLLGILKDEL